MLSAVLRGAPREAACGLVLVTVFGTLRTTQSFSNIHSRISRKVGRSLGVGDLN